MTSEFGDICLQSWMKLTLFTFRVIFGRFLQNALFNNKFIHLLISLSRVIRFWLFVLNDRTTCQHTKKSAIASSGTHFFVFLLFLLNVFIFLKLTPKMRNLKFKVPNKKN